MRREREQPPSKAAEIIYSCKMCSDQMFGGPRCYEHNPTPDQRDANPVKYPRMVFARRRSKAKR